MVPSYVNPLVPYGHVAYCILLPLCFTPLYFMTELTVPLFFSTTCGVISLLQVAGGIKYRCLGVHDS